MLFGGGEYDVIFFVLWWNLVCCGSGSGVFSCSCLCMLLLFILGGGGLIVLWLLEASFVGGGDHASCVMLLL